MLEGMVGSEALQEEENVDLTTQSTLPVIAQSEE
jgi:hypothetical protein